MFEDILRTAVTVVVSAIVGGAITYITAVRRIDGRVKKLEAWRRASENDTTDSAEERRLQMTGLLACLYGLKEQGCNGPVTRAIEKLETYLNDQAHRTNIEMTHRDK